VALAAAAAVNVPVHFTDHAYFLAGAIATAAGLWLKLVLMAWAICAVPDVVDVASRWQFGIALVAVRGVSGFDKSSFTHLTGC
jgi:hypothetical protein